VLIQFDGETVTARRFGLPKEHRHRERRPKVWGRSAHGLTRERSCQAQTPGLTLPPTLLFQVDEVIR
jgi:hypothetical protein